jgi:hypothetical protein
MALVIGRVLALAAVTAVFLHAPRLIGSLHRPVSPRILLVLGGILVAIGIWVWQPGDAITLFTRTMTIEAYKDAPLPDGFFRTVNPSNIDAYHAAVARELTAS